MVPDSGERIEAFHYLVEGETEAINAATGEQYGNATLRPGQFFGELAFFLNGGLTLMGGEVVMSAVWGISTTDPGEANRGVFFRYRETGRKLC